MTAFADAIAGGLASIADSAGVPIVYTRGANTVDLTAVAGRTRRSHASGDVISRDYMFKTAELILSGSATTPAIGDTITETIADVVTVLNVSAIDVDFNSGDQGPWRYRNMDHAHLYTRVHAVEQVAVTYDAEGQPVVD